MTNFIGDFSKEVIGALVAGVLIIVFIMVLSTLGESTGQSEITNSMITTILIVSAIGIPIGVVSVIKLLTRKHGP